MTFNRRASLHRIVFVLAGFAIASAGCSNTNSAGNSAMSNNPTMSNNPAVLAQSEEDCPPAAPLANRDGWNQASRAKYSAERVGQAIHVRASGENNTGGWQNVMAMNPTRIFPPQLTHWHKPPEGMATQAITPFDVCVKINVGDQKVRSIRVFFADGHEDVAVAEKK